MITRLITYLFLVTIFPSIVVAQRMFPANELVPQCDAANFQGGICYGMITAMAFVGPILPPELTFCPPAGDTNAQDVRVVLHYIEQHPERRHEDIRLLAVEAFRSVWPCK